MPRLRDNPELVTSSYLRQHIENPVEWYGWGDDALTRAHTLDRPIFISIGYAACHWCHVMAHESFESPAIAEVLNRDFVPIKVDREERPDIDALYMAATQLVSGHGGWPMSVFATPDGRPFMAGTYYPPTDRPGHVGFDRLLAAMSEAWSQRRSEVEEQANRLARATTDEIRILDRLAPTSDLLDLDAARRSLRAELIGRLDPQGGFSAAPKFPRTSFVEALLEFTDDEARHAVSLTMDSMSRGGLFDHLGGGFARYSVDDEWRVPHFEKMLSDQALLARCYLRAAKTFDRPEWTAVAAATLEFVERHLRIEGGYASSLDADADGEEGSHVTWTPDEVRRALHQEGLDHLHEAVTTRWCLTDTSFEGRSVPRLADGEPFRCPPEMRVARDALFEARCRRPAPGRDEKVVLEWNAMLASAFLLSGSEPYIRRATQLLEELATSHLVAERWWRTAGSHVSATCADVAWYADACLDAFEALGDDAWLVRAHDAVRYLLSHYWEGPIPTPSQPDVGQGFALVDDRVSDLATRPHEIFDGATPSAYSVGTRVIARLALMCVDEELTVVAQRLVHLASALIRDHAVAVPELVGAAGFVLDGIEVVVPGEANALSQHVRSTAMIRTVLVTGTGKSPLLMQRLSGWAYVCRGGVCALPVDSVDDLQSQLQAK